jgi:hypothetical protein
VRRAAVALASALVLGGSAYAVGTGVAEDLASPRDLHASAYVGSGACARCHPDHAESFGRTFHRTMTQEASEESVLAPFDGRELSYGGLTARMERSDDGRFVVEVHDAEARTLERWTVARLVGSRRHQQLFTQDGDLWMRLPVAWDVEEQRFFHLNGAFLTADPAAREDGRIEESDYLRHSVRWNDNCIFCHNVAPDPGLEAVSGHFESRVAELGVACEACHGPGSEHVRANASPVRRYALHAGDDADPTIVNPSRLSSERRSEVCGRCHGQRITDDVGRFLAHGDPFVPGDALGDYSRPLARDTPLHGDRDAFAPRFYRDGTARLTAYEYQGLLQSACTVEGELACTTCHGMHEGDPRGQIRPSMVGDAMCAGACHVELASAGAALAHSGHASVECVDCHMPRVVFGIRSIHRSHRIDVPRPIENRDAGRADACTLCHTDRGPEWAEAAIAARYQGLVPHPDRPTLVSALLGGDPIERAVAAAALGRPGQAGSVERVGLLLSAMRDDPYPAVRGIAWRSLRALAPGAPGVEAFQATDDAATRAAQIDTIIAALRGANESVVLPDPALVAELRARADARAIEIGE